MHCVPVSPQVLETSLYDFCNIPILYNYVQKKKKGLKKEYGSLLVGTCPFSPPFSGTPPPPPRWAGSRRQLWGMQPGTYWRSRGLLCLPWAPPWGHQMQAFHIHQPNGQETHNSMASFAVLHSVPVFKSICDPSLEMDFLKNRLP